MMFIIETQGEDQEEPGDIPTRVIGQAINTGLWEGSLGIRDISKYK